MKIFWSRDEKVMEKKWYKSPRKAEIKGVKVNSFVRKKGQIPRTGSCSKEEFNIGFNIDEKLYLKILQQKESATQLTHFQKYFLPDALRMIKHIVFYQLARIYNISFQKNTLEEKLYINGKHEKT